MPNNNSAKKRVRQDVVRKRRNRSRTSAVASSEKSVRAAIAANDAETAQQQYRRFTSALDRAVKQNVIKSGKADRKKSRVGKLIAQLQA